MSTTKTTHCKHGHERTPDNTLKDGRCRTCHNDREREGQKRRRAAARPAGTRPRTTHCPKGHERTPENVGKDRTCRICKIASATEANRRKRAAQRTPTPDEQARIDHNTRGRDNYLARRRRRLARLNRAARQKLAA